MKRLISVIPGIALVAILVAGCGSSSLTPPSSASGPSHATTNITFAYDWPTPDFGMVPMAVAMDKGYYKAAGLNLKAVFPPSNSSTMQMVGINQANVGYDTTTDVAFAKQQNVPIISIGNYSQSNNWGLVGRPGEKINVHALKGKKIGIYSDSWTKAMLATVLRHVGLTESDVQLVTATNDVIPLLLARKIDVATETTNFGAVEVKTTTGKNPTIVLANRVGAPNIPIWNFVANQKFANQHAGAVRAFLRATKKGMAWSIAHPSQAVHLFEKKYPKNGYSHASNILGWKATMVLLKGPKGFYTESNTQWAQLTAALKKVGVLKKVLKPGLYFTNRYQG